MLGTILRLYTAGMIGGVRTPVPHLFGPPGCGKSTFVEQAAQMLGVQLHSINVSRISPLELEGVQMPMEGKLELLLATYWNNLKDGDILFLDEFLRGFPEVYNGLLDILTSRTVAGHKLPRVFIIAASNSTTAYDPALTDRLLHLNVPDPRSNKGENHRIRNVMVEAMGLLPAMATSMEMDNLMASVVCPMYKILDGQGNRVVGNTVYDGVSPRNLIGQVQLRMVTNTYLESLLLSNNRLAEQQGKEQYIIAFTSKGRLTHIEPDYLSDIRSMMRNPKMSDRQRMQAEVNIQIIESFKAQEKEANDDPDDNVFLNF